ncbi:hypothetical protein NECID01_1828 [Nematocida sp. AWRm77]|nr:hypothetical protein NECID01_1828 [Nematocida sp. AWRm77]
MEEVLKEKMERIDSLVMRIKENKEATLVDILKEEIEKLKKLNQEYESVLQKKSVRSKEESPGKTKYTLSDGSIYVVHKAKQYKYLYDAATSVITYEFSNGQVERTFPAGIKEIRGPSGEIIIKLSDKEYEVVKRG